MNKKQTILSSRSSICDINEDRWESERRTQLHPILDKIIYGKLDINSITIEHIKRYSYNNDNALDCWNYFVMWKRNRISKGYL